MKAFLLHRNADFELQQPPPAQASAVSRDLELETLLNAMAGGDEYWLEVARAVILSSMKTDVDTILYRQEIVQDCLKNPVAVRQLHDLALEAITAEKREYWGFLSKDPVSILHGAIRGLEIFVGALRRLRDVAERHAGRFESRGLTALFAALKKELSDDYLAVLREQLARLKFPHGVLLSAELGRGGATRGHLLRKPREEAMGWLARLFGRAPPGYTFRLHPRDEAGGRILSAMQGRGINLVANALAQSRDHVRSLLATLRMELAFYLGCLNLHALLAAMGEPACFPRPLPAAQRSHRFTELYDVCLALTMKRKVVGNSADAGGKSLVIVTGANQGGKSTFLRSIGLAQLMMQAGMFVPAESFEGELCSGVFTHYKREEDPTMKSGKFDEELSRMSEIADRIGANALALFNESFAATNELEGSEIARQVASALLEKRVKVFFVTHQYEFARRFFESGAKDVMFLRAERKADAARSFRLLEEPPLATSFGADLYHQIFGGDPEAEDAGPAQAAAKQVAR